MIDISLMSKQEKIIIVLLLGLIVIVVLFSFTPKNMRNERKAPAVPQNIFTTGGAAGSDKGYFNTPRDIARDKAGNTYVVDSRNHRIQKFNLSGDLAAAWGKEGNGPGEFKEPNGIDVSDDGNIYVADTWNGRVQVFSNTGSYLREFGGDRGMWGPRDVGVDAEGNAYVADTGNGLIVKFDKNGKYISAFGKKGGGKAPGEFLEPFSIKFYKNQMYVVDRKNFRIQVLSPEGRYIREIKVEGWSEAQVINGCLMEPYHEIDRESGKIYITDSTNHRIAVYSNQGSRLKLIDKDVNNAVFSCPIGIVVMSAGKLLAADSATGKITTIADNN